MQGWRLGELAEASLYFYSLPGTGNGFLAAGCVASLPPPTDAESEGAQEGSESATCTQIRPLPELGVPVVWGTHHGCHVWQDDS